MNTQTLLIDHLISLVTKPKQVKELATILNVPVAAAAEAMAMKTPAETVTHLLQNKLHLDSGSDADLSVSQIIAIAKMTKSDPEVLMAKQNEDRLQLMHQQMGTTPKVAAKVVAPAKAPVSHSPAAPRKRTPLSRSTSRIG
jgi:hypothetical protein